MSKWVTGIIMVAPVALFASPMKLRTHGYYYLKNKNSDVTHTWKNTTPVEVDQKTVVDRVKKESCAGSTCQSFELLTELTAHELPNDMLLVDVAFTNTSDGVTSHLSGETKMRNHGDSGKLELKSETNATEHFTIDLSPVGDH